MADFGLDCASVGSKWVGMKTGVYVMQPMLAALGIWLGIANTKATESLVSSSVVINESHSERWTNHEGREMRATLKEVRGDKAIFLMANGSLKEYLLASLSVVSRGRVEQLRAWDEGIVELRKQAEKGDAAAQFRLGTRLFARFRGNGPNPDWNGTESMIWYRKSAAQGFVLAQASLGFNYFTGISIEKNTSEGIRWWRLAATQGDAESAVMLGFKYLTGDEVVESKVEAAKWFRIAADAGDLRAQNQMGLLYEYGNGVVKNQREAAKWYRRVLDSLNSSTGAASPAGDEFELIGVRDEACWRLGRLLLKGEEVIENPREAARLFAIAADHGNARSQALLANCYAQGTGVAKDAKEAVYWYKKAASQDDVMAEFYLGGCYLAGEGVVVDDVMAYKWFSLAAAHGLDEAKQQLAKLESRMTRAEIAQGQGFAREEVTRRERELAEIIAKAQKIAKDSQAGSRNKEGSNSIVTGASGTGFFISEDGYCVTNAHVVANGTRFEVRTAKAAFPAKLVKLDVANDLAILKIESKTVSIAVVSSRDIRLGQAVFTIGFPNIDLQGMAPKLAKGEIAALSGVLDDARYFQISVPLQPGNSGGALVDEHGNVVGIVSAKLSAKAALESSGALPENVNYAIKSSYLLSLFESVTNLSIKLKEPSNRDVKFEDGVKAAQDSAVLVFVN